MQVSLTVNGQTTRIDVPPERTLLQVLRDDLGLKGTKDYCHSGVCGTCTVLADGAAVSACSLLAAQVDGKSITTVEGLEGPDGLHPIQQAFLENAALQCGICTPGFIVASKALLDAEPNPSEERIRLWLAGNLCRCTGYDKIVRAVMDASRKMGAKV